MRRNEVAWLLIMLMIISTFGYALLSSPVERKQLKEDLIRKGYTLVEVVNLTNQNLREFFDTLPDEYETNLGEKQIIVIYEDSGNFSGVRIRSSLGEKTISSFNESEVRSALCDLLLFKPISCLNLSREFP